MRPTAVTGLVGTVALCGCLLAAPVARAQDVRILAPAPAAAAEQPLSPQESETLSRALALDPASDLLGGKIPALKLPGLGAPAALDIGRNDKPDGSSTVTVRQPLPSTALDSKIGADLNLAAPGSDIYEPGKPLPGTAVRDAGSADAWATVGVGGVGSLDARVNGAGDQGKLGGTLKHTVPITEDVSVTVEDSYSMTQSFNPAASATAAATATAPAPQAASAEIFGNSKSVKLGIVSTGTTFGAGVASASNDPVSHNTISAEQKVIGPLHVTTAVTDVGQPTENKSVSAGLKLTW
ncbi:MAG TPA: hypothetical protein VFA57_11375 [Pseudolabrys sp.]|nr:hypothetical protein [Pseudolabrys sp.]